MAKDKSFVIEIDTGKELCERLEVFYDHTPNGNWVISYELEGEPISKWALKPEHRSQIDKELAARPFEFEVNRWAKENEDYSDATDLAEEFAHERGERE